MAGSLTKSVILPTPTDLVKIHKTETVLYPYLRENLAFISRHENKKKMDHFNRNYNRYRRVCIAILDFIRHVLSLNDPANGCRRKMNYNNLWKF